MTNGAEYELQCEAFVGVGSPIVPRVENVTATEAEEDRCAREYGVSEQFAG